MSEKTTSTTRKAAKTSKNGEWTTVDTTGMTAQEKAKLAESVLADRKRKPSARHNVATAEQKGSKNTGKHPSNVKSAEDPRSNNQWRVHNLKGLSEEDRNKVMADALAEAAAAKPKRVKPKKAAPAQPPTEAEKPEEKRPRGRPSDYSEEIADLICEALAEGRSLRSICQDDNMPNKGTVFRWLAAHESFRDQYARAREAQADCLFDDMLDIADDGRNDTYVDDNGNYRTDHDVIARSKLRVETRKWMAGKLKPKVYGDKVDVNHGGQEGNPIVALLQQVNGTALKVKDRDES